MLVLVTLLWGLSFSLMKNWHIAAASCPGGLAVAGLTMTALRMFLALGVLALFLPRLFLSPSRREFGIGFLLGAINSIGFAFQVIGLAWTSPALSAFVTSLASAWVPLLMFVLFRVSVHRLTLIGLVLGIGGAAVLGIRTGPEDGASAITFGWGEVLTFLSTWFFALVIVLLDRFGRGVESARQSFAIYADAARLAHSLGLGVNAGHDLDLDNLTMFRELPFLDEVSIGHAIVSRAIFAGLSTVVREYLAVLAAAEGMRT